MGTLYTSTLLGNTSFNTLDSITEVKQTPLTDFETLLEFNEEIFVADLVVTRDFYNGLLESGYYVLHESVLGAISAFIQKVVRAIANFFRYIFTGKGKDGEENPNSSASNLKRSNETLSKKVEPLKQEWKAHKLNDEIEVDVFDFDASDSSSIASIIGSDAAAKLNNLTSSVNNFISKVGANNSDPKVLKEEADRIVSMLDELLKAINSYDISDRFKITAKKVKMSPDQFVKYTEDLIADAKDVLSRLNSENSGKPSEIPSVESTNEYKAAMNSFKSFENIINNPNAEPIADSIRTITSKQAEVFKAIAIKYKSIYDKTAETKVKQRKSVSSIIDSLLGRNNEDKRQKEIRDIISDELGSTVENSINLEDALDAELAEYRYSLMECYKRGIVKEAMIKANPEADEVYEMQALNEAILNSAKNAFNNAIAKIKEIFRKFMEKLRANFTSTRNYLDKYKNIILNNRLPDPSYTCKNLIVGMQRVEEYTIPAFNYNEIKGKLGTYGEFFTEIRPTNSAEFRASVDPASENSLASIATYFKEYFGMTKEDYTITAETFQSNMRDIYDFMYDIRQIERKINNDIKRVEGMRTNAMRQAGIPTTNTPTQAEDSVNANGGTASTTSGTTSYSTTQTTGTANTGNRGTATTAESYYSYINNLSVFMEVKPNNPNRVNNASTSTSRNTGSGVANKMNNVQTTGTVNTRGEEQYGVQGTPLDELNTNLRTYVDVTTTVLKAKLTAVEFLRSEFMQLFRIIVGRYVDGEAQNANQARQARQ